MSKKSVDHTGVKMWELVKCPGGYGLSANEYDPNMPDFGFGNLETCKIAVDLGQLRGIQCYDISDVYKASALETSPVKCPYCNKPVLITVTK